MKDFLHYEQDGREWIWYWDSWMENDYSGDRVPFKYYCTSKHGDGIFFVDIWKNERSQITGTCQFSLNGLHDPKSKIRRYMKSRMKGDYQ